MTHKELIAELADRLEKADDFTAELAHMIRKYYREHTYIARM